MKISPERSTELRFAAQIDIGRDVERFGQIEFLMNQRNAGLLRVIDVLEADVVPVETQRSFVGPFCTPARIFISVDLPAPFSPTTETTSPDATLSDTPAKA